MPPEKIGRYEIKAELGHGGMATVYRAHDPRFKRDVAVKVLPAQFLDEPTFRARFEREAQTIAAMEHPNIVPVYDFGEENGQPYLVMRYMPGGSLADRLNRGPMPPTEVSHIIARLAAALDQVHAHGIIHRDLKPANILFDQYGEAYLSDFGIARLTEATTMLTGDSIVGTPAYMSPEQARGESNIDGRSDLYALGVILFQMLAGRQPYEATTPIGVVMKHITEPVPSLHQVRPDLPTMYDQVIEGAMAKERDKRFATGSELLSVLQKALQEMGLPASSTIVVDDVAPAPVQTVAPSTPPPVPAPVERSRPQPSSPEVARVPSVRSAAKPAVQRAARPPKTAKIPLWLWIAGGVVVFGVLCGVIATGAGLLSALFPQTAPTQTIAAIIAVEVTDTPVPEVTSLPSASSTPAPVRPSPTTGNVLFKDDFSNTNSGWRHYIGANGSADYDRGNYHIVVDIPNDHILATSGLSFSDVVIGVEASKVAGPDDNYFGVLCRYRDDKNYYFFTISSDGYYAIGKSVNGQYSLIRKDSMTFSDAIHVGNTTNGLSVGCVGDTLTLYVNSLKLAVIQDTAFTSGDVGLIVGTYNTQGASLLFDNFTVTKP